jgi:hypothetical protein
VARIRGHSIGVKRDSHECRFCVLGRNSYGAAGVIVAVIADYRNRPSMDGSAVRDCQR